MRSTATGIEYLKDVVINDKLGIAADLDAQMQHIVDTYQDEWATVVNVRLEPLHLAYDERELSLFVKAIRNMLNL